MSFVQFNSQKLSTKKVQYTGSDTLKVGYLVCYNFDTTTDMDGTTISEGSQCNAKYLTVERPAAANLQWFAGTVLKLGSLDGEYGDWITIAEPNGAQVPVWTNQNCTVGRTLLALRVEGSATTDYMAKAPVNASSTYPARVIGIADETVDRSSTTGLVLASIGGNFAGICQGYAVSYSTLMGAGSTSGTHIANTIFVKSTQTGGNASALRVRMEANGAGMNIGFGAIRAEGVVNAAITHTGETDVDACAASTHLICKGGVTPAAGTNLTGLYAKLENQDGTPATLSNASISAATFVLQNDASPSLSAMLRFVCQGDDKPDYFFVADSADAIGLTAQGGTATTTHVLPIKVGGTAYWVALKDGNS